MLPDDGASLEAIEEWKEFQLQVLQEIFPAVNVPTQGGLYSREYSSVLARVQHF
jgi:hypothetical protein